MTQASTLVALATYNEVENLPRLVDEIFFALPNADILVVDDNSPDGTGRWCDERASTEPRLRCLHRESKLGLGSATIEAMRFAIDHGYEKLVTMDSDLSHDPAHLPSLVEASDAPMSSSARVIVPAARSTAGRSIAAWQAGC